VFNNGENAMRVFQGGTVGQVGSGFVIDEDQLEQLRQERPDRDDPVAVLRWQAAWALAERSLDDVAAEARVSAGTVAAFLGEPATVAGGRLTLAEAGRLMRLMELVVEDRALAGEADDHRRIAACYLEAAGLDFDAALRRARQARREYRAANPAANRLGLD
jgi:hypothetical protein